MKSRILLAVSATVLSSFYFSSCSNDDLADNFYTSARKPINFSVSGMNSTRSGETYTTGLDVNEIRISSWMTKTSSEAPKYGFDNRDNSSYFHNAILRRSGAGNQGSFMFDNDTYYWPQNGENLDFFAIAGMNEASKGEGTFKFDNTRNASNNYIPGLDWINQRDIDEMSDIFWAYSFNKKLDVGFGGNPVVNLSFQHALAKVVVTAEVRNSNIRVYITDMDICGLVTKGKFNFPHKTAEGENLKLNEAGWQFDPADPIDKTIHCPIRLKEVTGASLTEGTVVLDMNIEEGYKDGLVSSVNRKMTYAGPKHTLVGSTSTTGKDASDLFVLPYNYKGRNDGEEIKTYIRLKCYVYNKAGSEFSNNDALIYSSLNEDGKAESKEIYLPVEFDFAMGSVNVYNIVFDSGSGGMGKLSRMAPAFAKIGYEVDVKGWQ